jgi:hypothetical protein
MPCRFSFDLISWGKMMHVGIAFPSTNKKEFAIVKRSMLFCERWRKCGVYMHHSVLVLKPHKSLEDLWDFSVVN